MPQLVKAWMETPKRGETSICRNQTPDRSRGITMERNEKKEKDPLKRMDGITRKDLHTHIITTLAT